MDEVSKWRGRFFRYAPVLIVSGLILLLSSTEGSFNKTSRFVRPLLEFFFPLANEVTLAYYHSLVRKSAHLIEYGVLGFFIANALFNSSRKWLYQLWYLIAVGFVLVLASIDEINQSFNPTRTGSIYDVWLDTIGGLIGVSLFYVLVLLYRRFFKKKRI